MRLRFQLIVLTLLRTVLNTMHRMVYPFLSIFARGLGVDVATLSLALTARNAAGIFGPFFAPVADRRGRRFGMLAGVLAFTLGMGLVALQPNLATFSAALILAILSKSMFDPALHAYFGDRVPYGRRGAALAVIEMSWSLAFIAGVPMMGWLIARGGWSSPFPVLLFLGAVMFGVVLWMIPDDPMPPEAPRALSNLRLVLNSIPALAGLSIALWTSAGNELVNLIFGVWLEDSFGLKIAALASASAVIGFSELSGEGLVALTTDRLGKPRAIVIGLALNTLAALALPLLGRSQAGALVGLFLFYITFEYVVVSQLPMMTELLPKARATVMALNLMTFGLGRSLGSLLSTFIYQRSGFLAVTLVSISFNVFALLALAEMQGRITLLPRLYNRIKRLFLPSREKPV